MYDFEDKGGRHDRPAARDDRLGGAGLHPAPPPIPWKCWYAGSNFRYERPQAGRFREFHQIGIEAFGSADPDLDVEVIALGWEFYAALGLARVELLLNSLGDGTCRPAYRELLLAYLDAHRAELCDEHRGPAGGEPAPGPRLQEARCRRSSPTPPASSTTSATTAPPTWSGSRPASSALGIPYRIDTTLVRGSRLLHPDHLRVRGRSAWSRPRTPSAAAAATTGWSRRWAARDAGGRLRARRRADPAGPWRRRRRPAAVRRNARRLDVFVVDFAGGDAARDLTAELRAAGLRADRAFDGRSAKAQFKAADRSGARLALVVGPDEAAAGTVGIKDLVAGGDSPARPSRSPVADVRRRLVPVAELRSRLTVGPGPRRCGRRTAGRTRHVSLHGEWPSGTDDLFSLPPLNERLAAPGPAGRPDAAPHPRRDRRPGPPAGPGRPLRALIEADRLSSVILWGPPGTGKTTLARLIAGATRKAFVPMSAVTAGVKDVRETVAGGRRLLAEQGRGTILFLDEVHRFNQAQQDALLPAVEDGTLILIGATTENPYFAVNAPLLSRSTLFRLEPLDRRALATIVQRALSTRGGEPTPTPWRCSSTWSTGTPGPP